MNRQILDQLTHIQNNFEKYTGRDPEGATKYLNFLNTVQRNILTQLNVQISEQLEMIPTDRHGSMTAHQILIRNQVLKYTLGEEVDYLQTNDNIRPEVRLGGIIATGLADFFDMLNVLDGVSVGTEIDPRGHMSVFLSFDYTTEQLMAVLPGIINHHEQRVREAEMYDMIKTIFDKLA